MTAKFMQQWKLPGKLREISGLAITFDGRALAVADEKAVIYELDYAEGKIVKAFALGDPTVNGDFEGIATIDDLVYLTTSDGDIYRAEEGEDGDRMNFRKFVTGLGEHCEIEGLASLRSNLLLLCKNVRSDELIDRLAIFVWSAAGETLVNSDLIELPEGEILQQLETDRLNPSGLAVDTETGNLLIVAAQQRALVELTAAGEFVQALRMPLAKRHRQAEGIEITRAQQMLLADEGGRHKARLAVYRPTGAGVGQE